MRKINIVFSILAILISIVSLIVAIIPCNTKKSETLETCIEKAKLINEYKLVANCSDYNSLTYECKGIYVNRTLSEWNYQDAIKSCLEEHYK